MYFAETKGKRCKIIWTKTLNYKGNRMIGIFRAGKWSAGRQRGKEAVIENWGDELTIKQRNTTVIGSFTKLISVKIFISMIINTRIRKIDKDQLLNENKLQFNKVLNHLMISVIKVKTSMLHFNSVAIPVILWLVYWKVYRPSLNKQAIRHEQLFWRNCEMLWIETIKTRILGRAFHSNLRY